MKPILLDLFCGAGIGAKGYKDAGFYVIGVDMKPQKRYAGDEFHQGDALAFALEHGWRADAIHASPPCQAHSRITPDKSKHVDLIPQTRFVLRTLGKPYVIENVPGAPLLDPIMLCGAQFGLKVYRHRLFESNMFLLAPSRHYPHRDNTPRAGHGVSGKGFISVTSGGKSLTYASGGKDARTPSGVYGMSAKGFVSVSGHITGAEYCRWAMGVDWYVSAAELVQGIPPAYTRYIGMQIMLHLQNREADQIS